MGYNGYKNWETWNCKLWLDNDLDLYEYVKELVRDFNHTRTYLTIKEDFILTLADSLSDFIEEYNPLAEASLYTDLLGSAINEIDFYEIAGILWDEFNEDILELLNLDDSEVN